jgi:imidazolonepropionase-like amidohydrolase
MRHALLIIVIVAAPAAAQPPAVAIRNATVETLAAAGRVERATVVLRGGKVEAVGQDVPIPDDATVIDARGGTLIPGIIDPHFEVAVAAATADAGGRTIVLRGRALTLPSAPTRGGGFTRVADNFYPYDAGFKPLPRAGLTRLNLVTGGAGQAAVVRVTPADPGGMLDRADGLAFATVTNSTDSLDQVRTRLEAVAQRSRAGGSSGRPTGGPGGMAPAAGAKLWQDVHEGKAPLLASASSAAAVAQLLRALEPYKNVKLVLHAGGDTVAETVDALKGRTVRVILRPGLDLVPNTRDRFNAARLLHEAGVEFAFSLTARPQAAEAQGRLGAVPGETEPAATPGPADQDFPLFPVALLVKTGLPRQAALEALTKKPAALLGLDATHGTIEPGKAADLLLYTGDPLDPAGRLRLTLIDGRTVYAN